MGFQKIVIRLRATPVYRKLGSTYVKLMLLSNMDQVAAWTWTVKLDLKINPSK